MMLSHASIVFAAAAIFLAIPQAGMAQGCQPRLHPSPITSMTGDISAMVSADDGRGGKAIYFGGTFSSINGRSINRIARWWPGTDEIAEVATWQGAAIPAAVNALYEFADPAGTAIFAATSNGVWKLVGDTWMRTGVLDGVRCDDFTVARVGGIDRLVVTANRALSPAWMWTGSTWSAIGSVNTTSWHRSIATLPGDDGDSQLVLGNVGPAQLLWDGIQWVEIASGSIPTPGSWSRTDVFVMPAAGEPAPSVIMVGPQGGSRGGAWRLQSNTWTNVGLGQVDSYLHTLDVFDLGLGQGPQLLAGGWGLYARQGENWTTLINSRPSSPQPLGQLGRIYAMKAHRASPLASPVLVLGGSFQVQGTGAVNLAYLSSCLPCAADFNRSGAVTIDDLLGFLQAWFSGATSADLDGVLGVSVEDLFAFLGAWPVGCP